MCGIVGLIGTPDASREAFLGLTTLQHRGQDAAGILTYDTDGFHRVKNLGLVESVFTRDNMATLTGNLAVGHARYSTIGRGDLIDVQPFLLSYPFGLGMAHNGNLVNVKELARELRQSRRHLLTQSDTEILLNLFADSLAKSAQTEPQLEPPPGAPEPGAQVTGSATVSPPDAAESAQAHARFFEHICAATKEVFRKVNGSYSIVTMVADQGLIAFRDPHGIRPLVWGKRKSGRREGDAVIPGTLPSGEAHMVSSESVALSFLGYDVVRNVQPGEAIFIDMQGGVHTRVLDQRQARPCMFEWVYFASPEAEIDRVPVYGARINLGKRLAKGLAERIRAKEIEADIIVPVPETSRIAAIALAEELKIPYREVLIKNRYIKRTFILDSQEKRQKAVNLKLSPVRSEIEGKRVLLVDDSIVRGTTSKKIVELVRQAGASKVYFVSTCPPIKHPCFYGIDFPVEKELIANGRDLAAIEKTLGADAVVYQDLEGLRGSIADATTGVSDDGAKTRFRPCMACLDGNYPTDVSKAGSAGLAAVREADRHHGGK